MVAVTSAAVVRILRFIEAPFCSIAAMRRRLATNATRSTMRCRASWPIPKEGGDCSGHALRKDLAFAPRGGGVSGARLSKNSGLKTKGREMDRERGRARRTGLMSRLCPLGKSAGSAARKRHRLRRLGLSLATASSTWGRYAGRLTIRSPRIARSRMDKRIAVRAPAYGAESRSHESRANRPDAVPPRAWDSGVSSLVPGALRRRARLSQPR